MTETMFLRTLSKTPPSHTKGLGRTKSKLNFLHLFVKNLYAVPKLISHIPYLDNFQLAILHDPSTLVPCVHAIAYHPISVSTAAYLTFISGRDEGGNCWSQNVDPFNMTEHSHSIPNPSIKLSCSKCKPLQRIYLHYCTAVHSCTKPENQIVGRNLQIFVHW